MCLRVSALLGAYDLTVVVDNLLCAVFVHAVILALFEVDGFSGRGK